MPAMVRRLTASWLIACFLGFISFATAGHALPFLKKKAGSAADSSDKLPPPDAATQAELDKAARQMQNKDYRNARITYKALFVERPFDPQVLLGIAEAAERYGDLDEALKYSRECTVCAPNDPRGHMALGAYLEENRDLKAAYLQYARVMDLNPPKEVLDHLFGPMLRVLMNLSTTSDAEKQKDSAEAQRLARKWAKDYPADADCQYNLGWVLSQCGDDTIPDAVASYRAALKLSPANAGIRYNLALLLLRSRQNTEAYGELQQFLKLAPNDSDAPRAKELIEKLQPKAVSAPAAGNLSPTAAPSDATTNSTASDAATITTTTNATSGAASTNASTNATSTNAATNETSSSPTTDAAPTNPAVNSTSTTPAASAPSNSAAASTTSNATPPNSTSTNPPADTASASAAPNSASDNATPSSPASASPTAGTAAGAAPADASSAATKPAENTPAPAQPPAASDPAKPQDQAAKNPADTPVTQPPANQSTTIMMQPMLKESFHDYDAQPELLAYRPIQLADSDATALRKYQPADGADLIGTKAPEFSGLKWIGTPYTLTQLRGKVVLIRFWLADCSLCSNSAPALNSLYKRYGSKGLVVIGIHHPKSASVRDQAVVEQAAKRNGFNFPIAIDNNWQTINSLWLRGKKHPFTSASLLIDRNGIIRWVHPGGELLLDAGGDGKSETAFASLDYEVQQLLAGDSGSPK
jgi:tetratricopeptide (TPR) repeat protein/peroxiredoxin